MMIPPLPFATLMSQSAADAGQVPVVNNESHELGVKNSMSFSARMKMNASILLEWRNIDYHMMVKSPVRSTFLKTEYDTKHILKSINGSAKSGELLAIMGPTGCGKTSLLNVLAARAPTGNQQFAQLVGNIFVNGKPREDERFRNVSAYVLQDDKLFPHLTVYETLIIAAHFYLPSEIPLEEKEQLVDDVIAELGLTKARNTIIGDEKVRGVSGGERRRANIATQLITNPAVLFLDEPTSGLDSFQAQSVMEAMKSMAENNRMVISVIHQPRSSIYNMFDRLLLLSEGKQMFFGYASEAVAYFSAAGYPCPSHFNPSDYFLDILSPDTRSAELEEQSFKRIDQFAELFIAKNPPKGHSEVVEAKSPVITPPSPPDLKRTFKNLQILSWRSFTEQLRDIATIRIRFITSCAFGLIIGGIYSDTKHNQQGVQNIVGLFFLITLNQAFNNMITVLNVFPKEKIIVFR